MRKPRSDARQLRFEPLEGRSMLAFSPVLVGAHLIYNNSAFDDGDPAAGLSDDAAIATDKTRLLPGQTASFANYSSYDKGINALAIDLRNLGPSPTVADFVFKTGRSDDPSMWSAAPAPTGFSLRRGDGLSSSDRVTVVWADGAIKNTWLQVTVVATGNVFYFGSAMGETGNSSANAFVSAADEIGVRNNVTDVGELAGIGNVYDFNRDNAVNAADELIARSNRQLLSSALPLISAPQVAALNLVVSSDSPTVGLAGEVVHYEYHVHNTGSLTLTSVTLAANQGNRAARQADMVGDGDDLLEAGEIWRYTNTAAVTQQQLSAGVAIVNTATADSLETGADIDNTSSTIASLTGDVFGNLVVRPITHASFVMSYQGKTIYVDPDGAVSLYAGIPKADYVLITHTHSDHFDPVTIAGVINTNARIIAPQAVYNSMSAAMQAMTTVLDYNATSMPPDNIDLLDELGSLLFNVRAVPAYNSNHSFGSGNGYVVTIDEKRIYISGDTGAQPELRALEDIDIAFVCMNTPFTMTPSDAMSLVRDMKPKVVYPYHYRNQDGTTGNSITFKNLMSTDFSIEVRLRKWY
ncbi:MAG TPA: MBL fold metallo-hydrolase [Lacipirellulaceae bacterium]|nr:MBL fold metallo-hydrolase [Lacipirellulaceae bacterium]